WLARARGLAAVALALPLGASAEPPGSDAADAEPALPSTSPSEIPAASETLALVRGRLTGVWLFDSDLVIALDRSNSTLLASGHDVDGDGRVGRNRHSVKQDHGVGQPHRNWTDDAGDTIFAAELAEATRLVDALLDRRSQVGLLTFTNVVHRRALVGDPSAARAALAAIRPTLDHEWTGSNLARALVIAGEMLDSAPTSSRKERLRSILIFSDGRPTQPGGTHWASLEALAAARALGARGITVFSVAIGELADPGFLAELATASGGGLLSLEDLRSLALVRMPRPSDELELVIENLTTKRRAHNVRTFPDGSFDGLVPLAGGENLLEIRIVLDDAHGWSERRVVRYEGSDPATQETQPSTEQQLLELRDRSRESRDPGRDAAAEGPGS
ncbi:MAG: VWA domain-containing protein, partial [Myxococcales bacterium]